MTDAEFEKRIKRLHDRINGPLWDSPLPSPKKKDKAIDEIFKRLEALFNRIDSVELSRLK